MLLLLGFLTFVWIFGNSSEPRNFSYTLAVNPYLVLTFGDKYISRKGFTLDRFIGLKIVYGGGFFSEYLTIGSLKFGILPALGLYLGYSW